MSFPTAPSEAQEQVVRLIVETVQVPTQDTQLATAITALVEALRENSREVKVLRLELVKQRKT